MAHQVPAIATRVGGVPEVIEDGISGLLFPVGAVEAMAEAALELLHQPERLREMGQAGLERVQEHYCASAIVPRYEALYAAILRA